VLTIMTFASRAGALSLNGSLSSQPLLKCLCNVDERRRSQKERQMTRTLAIVVCRFVLFRAGRRGRKPRFTA
jgi:hypothetical protein